jgi:acyl carrier protein phosphodiesterase
MLHLNQKGEDQNMNLRRTGQNHNWIEWQFTHPQTNLEEFLYQDKNETFEATVASLPDEPSNLPRRTVREALLAAYQDLLIGVVLS